MSLEYNNTCMNVDFLILWRHLFQYVSVKPHIFLSVAIVFPNNLPNNLVLILNLYLVSNLDLDLDIDLYIDLDLDLELHLN